MWVCLAISAVVVLWLLIKAAKPSKRSARANKRTVSVSIQQRELREPSPRVRPAAEVEQSQIRWYGGGTTLTVPPFQVRDPAVYASPGRRSGSQWATDPSEILLAAEVRRPRGVVPEMGYWPWYSRIDPENRYQYLEWLASGKRTLPPAEGLLFLYYYGLERRLLLDRLDTEWVLKEVVRLRRLDAPRLGTREGNAFRKYTTNLLWFEVARTPSLFNDAAFATVGELTHVWNESMVAAPLAWLAHYGRPLPPKMALRIAGLGIHARQSVVTKRAADQFSELFIKRYQERFGQGMCFKPSGLSVRHTYRPASGGLSEVECEAVDGSGHHGQLDQLANVWNGCIDDLRGFSKLSAPAKGPVTVEVWEAMPEDLRGDTDHPLAPRIHEIVRAAQKAASDKAAHETMVHVGLLASQIEVPQRAKLTTGQSRKLALTLERCGFNVEPDARLSGRSYGWEQPVAIFPRTDEAEVDPRRYGGAACMLQLGLTVAEADGVVEPEELRHLAERIDAVFQLPPHEQRRLEALRTVLLGTGADLAAISKRLEASLSKESHLAVGRLLVAIAAADGGIDRKEMTALRRCFRALGLPPESLDAVIAELAPVADAGMVTVQAGGAAPEGEPIPAQGGLRLNREAISAIMAETRDVARLLAEAMGPDDETEETEETSPSSAGAQPVTPTVLLVTPPAPASAAGTPIPPRFAPFLAELATQPSWTVDEAGALARKHGLMLAGAIEAINDWSLETHGTPILDETDGSLTVDQSIL